MPSFWLVSDWMAPRHRVGLCFDFEPFHTELHYLHMSSLNVYSVLERAQNVYAWGSSFGNSDYE